MENLDFEELQNKIYMKMKKRMNSDDSYDRYDGIYNSGQIDLLEILIFKRCETKEDLLYLARLLEIKNKNRTYI
jgi:hypothetical protein